VTVAAARESSSAHTHNGCAAADAGERKPYTEQRRFGEVWISYPHDRVDDRLRKQGHALYHSFWRFDRYFRLSSSVVVVISRSAGDSRP